MKKTVVILFVLCLAVFLQIKGGGNRHKNLVALDLNEVFPREVSGWVVEDRPIAESPEMKKAVEEILNYDSALLRVYRRGREEISIYAAYWIPGKIYPQAIDAHTPDICWTANGWKMEKLPSLGAQFIESVKIEVPNNRLFTANDQSVFVVYWHINGAALRRSYSVTEEKLSVRQRLEKIWALATEPAQQQLFVRISSNQRIEGRLGEAPVRETLAVLARALRGEAFFIKKD